jgi:hypothetical protein
MRGKNLNRGTLSGGLTVLFFLEGVWEPTGSSSAGGGWSSAEGQRRASECTACGQRESAFIGSSYVICKSRHSHAGHSWQPCKLNSVALMWDLNFWWSWMSQLQPSAVLHDIISKQVVTVIKWNRTLCRGGVWRLHEERSDLWFRIWKNQLDVTGIDVYSH